MSSARVRGHEDPNEDTTAQEVAALGAHCEDRFHVSTRRVVHEGRGNDCAHAGVATREPERHRLRHSHASVLHQSRWQRPVSHPPASARAGKASDAKETRCGERRETSPSPCVTAAFSLLMYPVAQPSTHSIRLARSNE